MFVIYRQNEKKILFRDIKIKYGAHLHKNVTTYNSLGNCNLLFYFDNIFSRAFYFKEKFDFITVFKFSNF